MVKPLPGKASDKVSPSASSSVPAPELRANQLKASAKPDYFGERCAV